jgi:hypothetical protein
MMEGLTMAIISEAKAMEYSVKGIANLSNDELLEFIAYSKSLATSATKAAKERKLDVPKSKKVATVVSPEMLLLGDSFASIISANQVFIDGLFNATVTDEKKVGQTGINVATNADCPYLVQILNKAALKLKSDQAKEEKAKEKQAKQPTSDQVEAAEQAKSGTI